MRKWTCIPSLSDITNEHGYTEGYWWLLILLMKQSWNGMTSHRHDITSVLNSLKIRWFSTFYCNN